MVAGLFTPFGGRKDTANFRRQLAGSRVTGHPLPATEGYRDKQIGNGFDPVSRDVGRSSRFQPVPVGALFCASGPWSIAIALRGHRPSTPCDLQM